ncbi:MAG TPA: hypothetical protein VNM43_05865 [Dehalococcoidia bacterium]|nr:hypothetical protein [Dehalococcoidia bacterium]
MVDKRAYSAIASLSAFLAFVGSFLPWAKVAAPFVGEVSKSGIEGDGMITLLLALVAMGVVAWYFFGTGRGILRCLVLTAVGTIIALVAAVDITDAQGWAADVEREAEGVALARVGEGLYVTLIGGIGVAGAGALGTFLPIRRLVERPAAPSERE